MILYSDSNSTVLFFTNFTELFLSFHFFSLLYDTFFESIVFEDIGTLKSPFVAKMSTSPDMDRKIRVNIYYNSNLSGGKEIIIAATTFGLREMLRSTKQPFCSDLVSEHCVGAKAFLTPVCVPDTIFDTPRFWSLAPTKEKNPLRQEYVFYQETDTSPAVVRDEFAYEPAHVVNTSLAFLTHFRDDLKTSIVAWEDRCKLERIRQGKFVSVSEAARYGWHQLRLTIIASRIRSQLDVLNKTSAALFRDVIDSDDDEEGESTAGGLQGRNSTHASNSNADYTRTCNTFVEAYLEARCVCSPPFFFVISSFHGLLMVFIVATIRFFGGLDEPMLSTEQLNLSTAHLFPSKARTRERR